MLNHIVAIDRNNCIGAGDKLPWHIPTDLKYFKKITMGNNVYFGSKTFDSLPKINWGTRTPVRLSREIGLNGLNGWVCGGGEIYKATLGIVDTLYITEVDTICNGDVFYPEFKNDFSLQWSSEWMNENGLDFRFTIWRRK